ncbi:MULTISPECIES: YidB family protein [Psychrobacter]|uniref:YidB family protein n=1 Tax=Psychrobacter TaxID=497 RepID=UPI00146A7D76|nr:MULTISPECIES: YidB family protein [Psychrobacter]
MSLLGNLVTQIARSAIDPDDANRNPINQQITPRKTGGLGDILSGVLTGRHQSRDYNPQRYERQTDNHFGLDDILGGLMNSSSQSRGSINQGAGGLGDILGSILGSRQQSGFGGKGMLIAALLPVVLNWIQRNGGLGGALNKVSQLGYEHQARSWLSNHELNDNLDPNEVSRLFDDQDIQTVAAKTGANDLEVRQGLAELLPEVMNQLTPHGNLDNEADANQEIDQIIQQLSNRLGALKS